MQNVKKILCISCILFRLMYLIYFHMMCLSIVVAGTTAGSKDKISPKDRAGISDK